MTQQRGLPPLPPWPIHYYYENCFFLGRILGRSKAKKTARMPDAASDEVQPVWPILRAWARFSIVLASFLAVLYYLCSGYDLLYTKGDDKDKIVGLLNDYVNYGICTWALFGMPVFLFMLRKLDAVLVRMPEMIDTTKDPNRRRELIADIEGIRNFISIRDRQAKWCYYAFFAMSVGLVAGFAAAMPLLHYTGAKSWALAPDEYFVVFVVAQPWAFFWCAVVFAHYVWFLFCIVGIVFWRVSRYAHQRQILIPPISVDERGGLRSMGELVFLVMLLASGGLLIAVTWPRIFNVDPPIWGLIYLYAFVLSCLYLVPIWYLHVAMKHARTRHLIGLGIMFTAAYMALMNSTSEGNVALTTADDTSADPLVTRVSALEGIYARTEQMPTWPVSMLRNIVAALIPSISVLFSTLSKFVQLAWELIKGAGKGLGMGQ